MCAGGTSIKQHRERPGLGSGHRGGAPAHLAGLWCSGSRLPLALSMTRWYISPWRSISASTMAAASQMP
jgi:hypothetical protein